MPTDNSKPAEQTHSPAEEGRLDSWKEIADYLKRDVRTVQRWEKSEGLPVHRHLHSQQGTVYAYRSEVDAWWESRRPAPETAPAVPGEPAATAAPPSREPSLKAQVILAAATLALLGGYLVWQEWFSTQSPSNDRVMLAVLPFDDLGAAPGQEYFADGMTEELLNYLGRWHPERLGVIARTSAMQYKGTDKSVAVIGEELGVDYILEGSLRREAGHVRITAQLIQVSDQTHLWSETFDMDMTGMFPVWEEVAARLGEELAAELLTPQPAAPRSPVSTNPAANDAYWRGRYFLNKRSVDDIQRALGYFQRAVDADPKHAPAYAGLADAYTLLCTAGYDVLPPNEVMPQAREAALKALALDPTLSEAHLSLAYATMVYDWDWDAAEESFRRAIALNPNAAGTRHWYAYFLTAMDRSEEALEQIRLALKLDPVSLPVNAAVGWHLYFAGRYDEAIAQLRRTLELEPGFALARFDLGMAYLQMEQFAPAITELKEAARLGHDAPLFLAALGAAHVAAGQEQEARGLLEKLERLSEQRYVPALYLAGLHAALGEQTPAFDWLEKAYQERSDYLLYIRVDPVFQPLRDDPSFPALLRRMGLPPLQNPSSP